LKNNNVVYDATNIDYKRRKAFVESLNKVDCWKICVLIATPYEDCIRQNHKRDRQVPIPVISKMYKNFYIPQAYEGWDDITIVWNYDRSKYDIHELFTGINGLNQMNQDNPHHTLTIGQHCITCAALSLANLILM
jgi:predicted kinase